MHNLLFLTILLIKRLNTININLLNKDLYINQNNIIKKKTKYININNKINKERKIVNNKILIKNININIKIRLV